MRQAMKDRRDMDIEKGRTSSGFNSVTGPNITHAQKLGHAPERRHLTLLEALAKRSDALCGECADANWGYTA